MKYGQTADSDTGHRWDIHAFTRDVCGGKADVVMAGRAPSDRAEPPGVSRFPHLIRNRCMSRKDQAENADREFAASLAGVGNLSHAKRGREKNIASSGRIGNVYLGYGDCLAFPGKSYRIIFCQPFGFMVDGTVYICYRGLFF